MPAEILQLQERAANADSLPRREAIRHRIGAIMPLYRLSRYRPTQPPRQPSAESAATSGGDEPAGRPATRRQARSAPPTTNSVHAPANGEPANDESDGQPPADHTDHDPGSDNAVDLPDVAWVSARDGSRAPCDLKDQTARYHPGRHELTIKRGLPSDHRPDGLLARTLPRNPRRPRRHRGARARMVRADPRRGRARRTQLELEPRAARRAAVPQLANRGSAATTPAARDAAETTRPEARSPTALRVANRLHVTTPDALSRSRAGDTRTHEVRAGTGPARPPDSVGPLRDQRPPTSRPLSPRNGRISTTGPHAPTRRLSPRRMRSSVVRLARAARVCRPPSVFANLSACRKSRLAGIL